MNTGITLDYDAVMKRLIEETIGKDPVLLMDAMRQAGNQLKIDADDIPPRTPHLTGHLRGSGKVEVKIQNGEITGEVSYNTAYAERWHETDENINWSEADVGPKYLEKKLVDFNQKYLGMIADRLKEKYG
jgi:hypothetical protein